MLLANNGNDSMKTGGDIATATNKQTCTIAAVTTTPTLTVTSTKAPATTTTTTIRTATTSYDVERKYGKIPAEIYLLYLRASGLTIVLIFFITALIWQTLRVYTDVWLQQWTDDNIQKNAHRATVSAAAAAAAATNTTSFKQQQQIRQTYAGTVITASASAPALAVSVPGEENMDHHGVTYYFHIYAVISCVCVAMAMLSTPAGQWAGCKARQNLHDKLLQSIMHKSLHFFQITPLGRIMNRFSNDMAIIDKVSWNGGM